MSLKDWWNHSDLARGIKTLSGVTALSGVMVATSTHVADRVNAQHINYSYDYVQNALADAAKDGTPRYARYVINNTNKIRTWLSMACGRPHPLNIYPPFEEAYKNAACQTGAEQAAPLLAKIEALSRSAK